jgi:hypothetical protein
MTEGAVGNLEVADGRREEPLVLGVGDDILAWGSFGDCDIILYGVHKHLISPRGQKSWRRANAVTPALSESTIAAYIHSICLLSLNYKAIEIRPKITGIGSQTILYSALGWHWQFYFGAAAIVSDLQQLPPI